MPPAERLTPVAGSPFTAGSGPRGVVVDPSGKFVYAANEGSNNISAYSINATSGALTPVTGSPFVEGETEDDVVPGEWRSIPRESSCT